MHDTWIHLAMHLDAKKRFDAVPVGVLTVKDAYERMKFVFDEIEYCLAEGRLLDLEIFNRLEDLEDRVRRNDIPPFAALSELVDRMSSRYEFDPASISRSMWTRRADSGEYVIWIDQAKVVAESNERLFGRQRPG